MTTPTYSVIVRDPNTWNASTGVSQELNNCGHKHNTREAAEKCHAKLTEWRCLCGSTTSSSAPCCGTPRDQTSAAWWNAAVEEN